MSALQDAVEAATHDNMISAALRQHLLVLPLEAREECRRLAAHYARKAKRSTHVAVDMVMRAHVTSESVQQAYTRQYPLLRKVQAHK